MRLTRGRGGHTLDLPVDPERLARKPHETTVSAGTRLSSSFDVLTDAFDRAARAASEIVEHTYNLAGFCIRLRFAGPGLVPKMTPAFAHLAAASPAAPDLTICLWDSG